MYIETLLAAWFNFNILVALFAFRIRCGIHWNMYISCLRIWLNDSKQALRLRKIEFSTRKYFTHLHHVAVKLLWGSYEYCEASKIYCNIFVSIFLGLPLLPHGFRKYFWVATVAALPQKYAPVSLDSTITVNLGTHYPSANPKWKLQILNVRI